MHVIVSIVICSWIRRFIKTNCTQAQKPGAFIMEIYWSVWIGIKISPDEWTYIEFNFRLFIIFLPSNLIAPAKNYMKANCQNDSVKWSRSHFGTDINSVNIECDVRFAHFSLRIAWRTIYSALSTSTGVGANLRALPQIVRCIWFMYEKCTQRTTRLL